MQIALADSRATTADTSEEGLAGISVESELAKKLAAAQRRITSLTTHNRELLRALEGLDETKASQYRDRRRLLTLIENAPMCVHEIGLNGDVQSMNAKGLSMLNSPSESEVVGTPYLDSVDQSDKGRIEKLMLEAFAGHASEFEFATPGEEAPRTFASCFVPIFDELGNVERLMGCTREITDQLTLEASRQDLQKQLLHVQKLESLGLLAGGVAHDFNNMLAAIMGNLEIAKLLMGPEHGATGSLVAAQKAVDLGANLCSQLLAYAGKGRFGIQPLSVGAAATNVASMLKGSLPCDAHVTVHIEDEVIIDASAGQIDQVILNLLVNAADALQGETGRILLNVKRTTLEDVQFEANVGGDVRAGTYAELSVEDGGAGISAQTVAKIFDPFFSTKDSGRGLGLAAVGGIIRGHQGFLRVESVEGQGARFTVFLPVTDKPPASATKQESVEPRGRCILVVDDDDRVREASALLLEASGFETVEASSGLEALDLIREQPGTVAAVLLDVSMPGLSGPRTLEKLHEILPGLPVVLSSGWERSEIDTNLDDSTTFLAKPYSLEALMSALARVLPKGD